MAQTYRGQDGQVQFSGPPVTLLGGVLAYTVVSAMEAVDTTLIHEHWRTYAPGLSAWNGTMRCRFDRAEGQDTLWAILLQQAPATVLGEVQFGVGGDTCLRGTVVLTGATITAELTNVIEAAYTFTGTGPLLLGGYQRRVHLRRSLVPLWTEPWDAVVPPVTRHVPLWAEPWDTVAVLPLCPLQRWSEPWDDVVPFVTRTAVPWAEPWDESLTPTTRGALQPKQAQARTYRGQDGYVHMGGPPAVFLGAVLAYTVVVERVALETTHMQEAWRGYDPALLGWNGTMRCRFDNVDGQAQALAILLQVEAQSTLGEVDFWVGDECLHGQVLLTGATITAELPTVIEAVYTFTGNGPLLLGPCQRPWTEPWDATLPPLQPVGLWAEPWEL